MRSPLPRSTQLCTKASSVCQSTEEAHISLFLTRAGGAYQEAIPDCATPEGPDNSSVWSKLECRRMTLEFKFNVAFPDIEYMKGDNGVGHWVSQENGHEMVAGKRKYLLMMVMMTVDWVKKNVAVFVATDGPQGELFCVREWVKKDSSPSSFVPQIASCQVTERDLSFQFPLSHIPKPPLFYVYCSETRRKKRGRIHFSPAINPLRQVMYPPLSPYCGPFSPHASYGFAQKDHIYNGRPFGIPKGLFF